MKRSTVSLQGAMLFLSLNLVMSAGAQPAPKDAKPNNPAPSQPAMPPLVQKAAAAFNRGMLRQNEKRYPEALAAYKEFLKFGTEAKLPSQTLLPAHQNMALIYQQQGKRAELEASLRQIIAVDTQNAFALAQLAAFAVERKNYSEAESLANRALALKPPRRCRHRHTIRSERCRPPNVTPHPPKNISPKPSNSRPKMLKPTMPTLLHCQDASKPMTPFAKAKKPWRSSPNFLPAYLFLGRGEDSKKATSPARCPPTMLCSSATKPIGKRCSGVPLCCKNWDRRRLPSRLMCTIWTASPPQMIPICFRRDSIWGRCI